MRQAGLFDPPLRRAPQLTPGQRRAAAAEFVRWRRRSSVCAACCEDRASRLKFVHRVQADGNVPIAHLVKQGATRERIERELRLCVVLCVTHQLELTRPKMLRTWGRSPVGVGGTWRTATSSGRKRVAGVALCHVVKRA